MVNEEKKLGLMEVGGRLSVLSSAVVFFLSLIAAGITLYTYDIGRTTRAWGLEGYDLKWTILAVSIPLVVLSLAGFFLGVRARFSNRRAALGSAFIQVGFAAFAVTMIQREPRMLTSPSFFPDVFVLAVSLLSVLSAVLCTVGYLCSAKAES